MSERIEKFLFNKQEAALSLGISVRSVEYLISQKKLIVRRIGTRILVTRESLRRFAQADHFGPIRRKRANESTSK